MYIKRIIKKYFKIWGVKYEGDLPPEFIVTNHALDRLKYRSGTKEDKFKKIIIKAWYSSEYLDEKFLNKQEEIQFFKGKRNRSRIKYKLFNGLIFVFQLHFNGQIGVNQKKLITVYPKNKYMPAPEKAAN